MYEKGIAEYSGINRHCKTVLWVHPNNQKQSRIRILPIIL